MEGFSLTWSQQGEERTEGPFADSLAATIAARDRADERQCTVRVLRPDGSVYVTLWPESATLRVVRPEQRA